jgi:COP9 signalosome complex subunit 5
VASTSIRRRRSSSSKTPSAPSSSTPTKTGGPSKNTGADSDGFETIPLGKIEDFGVHASHYYSLEVSHFKSSLDAKLLEALWNKYWVQTLSSSPLISNRDYGTNQIADLARKMQQENSNGKRFKGGLGGGPGGEAKNQITKLGAAGSKIAREEDMGLLAAKVKDKVFNLGGEETEVKGPTEVQSQEIEMET